MAKIGIIMTGIKPRTRPRFSAYFGNSYLLYSFVWGLIIDMTKITCSAIGSCFDCANAVQRTVRSVGDTINHMIRQYQLYGPMNRHSVRTVDDRLAAGQPSMSSKSSRYRRIPVGDAKVCL